MPSNASLSNLYATFPWIKAELQLDKTYKSGVKGPKVKNIQEWLNFYGIKIKIDEDFGSVTDTAVRLFQRQNRLEVDGAVGEITYAALVRPMIRALRPLQASGKSFADAVKAFALQHCAEHPVEIGGDNRGPWVRLYMRGNEGEQWYWCAGFVSFVFKQAATAGGRPMPIAGSFSCDALAEQAKNANLFIPERTMTNMAQRPECCIFLVRRTPDDWTHTGFATGFDADHFTTIEGNTNDEGSRNGYEVCSQLRAYKGKDFIRIG